MNAKRIFKKIVLLFAISILMISTGRAMAATLSVPVVYSTIQAAVDAAVAGDIVLVDDGTYDGFNFSGKAITVQSLNGSDFTTLDGSTTAGTPVVSFVSGEGASSVLEGFSIVNGSAPSGGGIYCVGSSPVIRNCEIFNNQATGSAGAAGAGIYLNNSSPQILKCNIHSNDAQITDGGGGIACVATSNASIENSVIDGNVATSGAGIYIDGSSPSITNCTIANNDAGTGDGGGIFSTGGASAPTITNCTFSNNTANNGGAIVATATSASVSMVNCILWADVSVNEIVDFGTSLTITYSCVQTGYTGVGNITVDPLFVGAGFFHISSSSPCIDVGQNAGAPADDIDGDARPYGATVDMGSDEYVPGGGQSVWASPPSGTYSEGIMLMMFVDDTNAEIHYTLDGSTPTANSPQYVEGFPIVLTQDTTLNLFATDGFTNSPVETYTYTFTQQSLTSANIPFTRVDTNSGIYGGSIHAFTSGSLYCGTDNGAYVYNGNDSWNLVPQTEDMFVTAVKKEGGLLYVGTPEGLFISTGTTITDISDGMISSEVMDLESDGTFIYVVTPQGILRKQLGTSGTWTWLNDGLFSYPISSIFNDSGIIYIGTHGGGVYRFNGTSWVDHDNFGLGNFQSVVDIMRDGAYLYLYAEDDTGEGQVFEYNTSWTDLPDYAFSSKLYDTVLSFYVKNGKFYIGTGGDGIFMNSGSGWSAFGDGAKNLSVEAITLYGVDMYLATWFNGVYRANAANPTFIPVNDGIDASASASIEFVGHDVYIAPAGNIYKQTNQLGTFAKFTSGVPTQNYGLALLKSHNVYGSASASKTNSDPNTLAPATTATQDLYAALDPLGMYYLKSGATSFSKISTGLLSKRITSFGSHDSVLYAGAYTGEVYMLTKGSLTWQKIRLADDVQLSQPQDRKRAGKLENRSNVPFFFDVEGGVYVSAFAFGKDYIYISVYGLGIYRKTYDATTWSALPGMPPSDFISDIMIVNGSLYILTDYDGVYRRTLTSTSFQNISANIPTKGLHKIEYYDGRLFIASFDNGIFVRSESENLWKVVNPESKKRLTVGMESYGGYLYVSSHGGIYKAKLDYIAPTNASISINEGDITGSTGIKLTLTAEDAAGIDGYYLSESSVAPTAASTWVDVSLTDAFSDSSVSFTVTQTIGNKTIYCWFRDFAGNISPAVSDTIYYDPNAITGSITAPSDRAIVETAPPTFTATATQTTGIASIEFLYRQVAADGSTPSPFTSLNVDTAAPFAAEWGSVTFIHNNSYELKVTITDNTGNTYSPSTVKVFSQVSGLAAPTITTDGGNGPGVDYATNKAALSLYGNCSTETLKIIVNESTDGVTYFAGNSFWAYSATLEEGANYINVNALNDSLVSSITTTIVVTLDTIPPGKTEINSTGGVNIARSTSKTISGMVAYGESVLITPKGSSPQVGDFTYSTDGSWSVQITDLQIGKNVFDVYTKDPAGNVSITTQFEIIYLPLASLSAVASDGTIALSWNANPMPGHIGYKVYIGTQSGVYDNAVDVGNSLSYTASGLSNYVTYYIKVLFSMNTDEFNAGSSDSVTQHAIAVELDYTGEIYSTPFEEETSLTNDYVGGPINYQMFSIPFELADTDPVANFAPLFDPETIPPEYNPVVWRIYSYYGGEYHQYPDPVTELKPGRGYWLISMNDAIVELTGQSVDSSKDFEIEVPPGWSMMGNPFGFAVDVANIKVSDGTLEAYFAATDNTITLPELYYAMNKEYVAVTQILPNRAYWVKNTTGSPIIVKIPPIVAQPVDVAKLVKSGELAGAPPAQPADIGAIDAQGGCFIASASYNDTNKNESPALKGLIDILGFIGNIFR